METKSRYESLTDLENTKRELMDKKYCVQHEDIKNINKKIRDTERLLQDLAIEKEDCKKAIPDKVKLIEEAIKSIDETILRFQNLNSRGK